jgi:hypothetical protein
MPLSEQELRHILDVEEKKLLFEKRLGSGVITGQMIAIAGMREVERQNAAIEAALIRLLKDNDQEAVDAAHLALREKQQMRGLEPRGKNQSTDSSGVGDGPMKAELNGEQPQDAGGDGCLGTVKDRPAVFLHITPKCEHDWSGPEVKVEYGSSVSCAKCGGLAIIEDMKS